MENGKYFVFLHVSHSSFAPTAIAASTFIAALDVVEIALSRMEKNKNKRAIIIHNTAWILLPLTHSSIIIVVDGNISVHFFNTHFQNRILCSTKKLTLKNTLQIVWDVTLTTVADNWISIFVWSTKLIFRNDNILMYLFDYILIYIYTMYLLFLTFTEK